VLVLSLSLVTAAPVAANTDRLVPIPYSTIQEAINAAVDGDTIIVSDGTYTQDLTVNTPNLTLKSVNGSGVTTIEGVDGFVITLNSGATNFTLGGEDGHGFTVIGDAANSTVLLQTVGGPSGVEVSYNTFDTSGNPSIAIAVGAQGASNLTISNNTFDLYGWITGIYFDTDDVTNLVIDSNTFTAVSGSPKWLNWAVNAHVEGATISNNLVIDCNSCIRMVGRSNAFNNVSYTGNTIAGGYIAIGPSGSGSNLITNLAITNNSFTGPADEQVFFEILGSVPAAVIDWNSLIVAYNNFDAAPGEYAIKNGIGGTTLDAENNWWDDTSGPGPVGPGTGALVTDNVDYYPWLGAPVVVPSLHYETLGTGTHVVDATAEADTEATLTVSSETDLYIVKYQWQPFPEEPFPDASLGKFIDMYLSNPAVVDWPIYVEVYYTDGEVRAAGIAESSLGLYYYMSPDTFHRCSDTGVDTTNNIIWANMTAREASYLVRTPIGGGGSPAPAIVGGTVYPVDKVSMLMPWIGLAVALALASVFIARFARRRVRG